MTDKTAAQPAHAPEDAPEDAPESVSEYSGDEWGDETPAGLFLRAVFTLAAGTFLIYAQYHSPIYGGADWNRWIAFTVIANLLLPLGIVWLFFAQGIGHLEWLKDQRLNAWSYGWDFRQWKRHLLIAIILTVLMLPILFWASRDQSTQAFYRDYFPPVDSFAAWLWLIVSLVLYMFCWEWLHRGFLLFGMAQGFGWIIAVVLQAAVFGAAHWGKPQLEMWSSFAGGLLLGVLCWREKSFVPAFFIHALIHIVWTFLVLL